MARSSNLVAVLTLLTAFVAACSDGRTSNTENDDPVDGLVQDGPNDENLIPCAPREVLQRTCQQCHSRPTKNDAPFPLVTRSDIIRRGRNGATVRELIVAQLERRTMPLAPVTMEPAARETLLAWVRNGAASVAPQTCADADASSKAQDEPFSP